MAKQLYSYQRWSSAVQKEGTTQERQSHSARKYAESNGYEYNEIQDDGVSAFKSVNVTRGALAAFLRAVESGFIQSNSILYVESLDRISRDTPIKAVGLFGDVLDMGITIVTGVDNKTYTKTSINDNAMDLLQSILLFSRAHEESKTKQMRTNENAMVLIRRFQEGLPTTIQSIGSHPWWIDGKTKRDESVKKHPDLWNAAQFAILLFLEGESIFKVTQMLDKKFPHYYKNRAWQYNNVSKLRTNVAVYGLRVLNVGGIEYELPGYYPPLISESQFAHLQKIKDNNKYIGQVGTRMNNINLIAGLKVFRCGHCGGTMMAMRHNDTIRYLCMRGRGYMNDCKTWSLPGMLVEHSLMIVVTIAYIGIKNNGLLLDEDFSTQIKAIECELDDISKRISRGTKLLLNGLDGVEELIDQIRLLKEKRTELSAELAVLNMKQLQTKDRSFNDLMMEFFKFAQYGVLQDPVHEYREKLRQIVKETIDDAHAWKFGRQLYLSFRIKGTDEYYNFEPGTEKGKMQYSIGERLFSDESTEVVGLKGDGSTEVVDLNSDALEGVVIQYKKLQDEHKIMIDLANEMLSVVGYPTLSGKLFWPKK